MPDAAPPNAPVQLDRKAIFGWAMFDFANSSFTTVMVTAFFSVYFIDSVVPRGADGSTDNGVFLWGLAQGISQAVVIATAPFLGALADFSGAKKKFLLATYLGCGLSTLGLYFIGPGQVAATMALFIVANIFFSSGENFISAFLPEICPPDKMGRISGLAWGLGYIGGIGSLLLSVAILGDGKDLSLYPYVWLMIGTWFLMGGLPTFVFLKERGGPQPMPEGSTLATIGFRRLMVTLREARQFRQLFRFILIFMVYSSGVAAVINFASKIAKETLHFDTRQLGVFLIVTNLFAAAGAWGIGFLQDRIGSRRAIMLALSGWMVALVLFFAANRGDVPPGSEPSRLSVMLFWTAGFFVGMSMGATFAASRALVGMFSRADRAGEFFGLWGLCFKLGSIVGPVSFGVVTQIFSLRWATIFLGLYFAAGLFLMRFIDEEEGRAAAKTPNSA